MKIWVFHVFSNSRRPSGGSRAGVWHPARTLCGWPEAAQLGGDRFPIHGACFTQGTCGRPAAMWLGTAIEHWAERPLIFTYSPTHFYGYVLNDNHVRAHH